MNEFFTWELLSTMSVAALATSIITQGLKGAIDRLTDKLPTQVLSYIIALVILFLARLFTSEGASAGDWAIVFLDAILVSLSANGTYSAVTKVKDGISNHMNL